jgi:pantoate--beta-alanine ligase
VLSLEGLRPLKLPHYYSEVRRVKERRSLSYITLPPHARNIYPYHGEGDQGGEVDKNMRIIEKINDMSRLRRQLVEPVGLVPTMGYLHEGHLALVRQARAENPSVVVSIFVNPTQFGPQEDFKNYPRDHQHDLALLEKEKTDIVFMPSVTEMYPAQFSSWVEVGKVTERLEGAARPSHFRGVTTVVAKLFNIIQPTRAYFGQKDAQQAIVIKKMVADLNMHLEIVAVPTVREPDGLALSSRNAYLNPDERQAALVLHQALSLAQKLWSQGEKDTEQMRQEMIALIKKQPLADIDYVSIADAETLDELDTVKSPALVSLAVKIGTTRLIDNVVLK